MCTSLHIYICATSTVGALAAVDTNVVGDPEEIADWSLLVAPGGGPVLVIVKVSRESEKI